MDYNGFPLYYRVYKKVCEICSRTKDTLLNILLVVMVLFLIFSYIFGFKVMFIMSPSMEPIIKTHQLVLGKKVTDETELNIGDVCTYKPNGRDITITHRIIGKMETGYVFKGDNNSFQDEDIVKREQIIYKLVWY